MSFTDAYINIGTAKAVKYVRADLIVAVCSGEVLTAAGVWINTTLKPDDVLQLIAHAQTIVSAPQTSYR